MRWRIPKYFPGWIVTGGGGSGGSSTPTGWPLTFWYTPRGNSAQSQVLSNSGNTLNIFCFEIDAQVQFSKIFVEVGTADNANNCDFGLYASSGTLAAHIGAQHLPATGQLGFSVVGAPLTLNPGLYGFATTSVAATAALIFAGASGGHCNWRYAGAGDYAVTAGGVLPNSITFPTSNPIANDIAPNFALGA